MKVKTRARRAVQRIDNMIREQTQWKGVAPSVVRVRAGDYLALVECGYLTDDKLPGSDVEIKIG